MFIIKYYISVIIPVYNAEKTLKRCIDSVVNQSIGFENIELILIDDKSTDNSMDIIESYDDKFDNIKSIALKENSGNPSFVRSVGIDNATASYLMFLDNDDTYEKNMCEILYRNMEENNVDYVQCNHKIIINGEDVINSTTMDMFPEYPIDLNDYVDVYAQTYFWDKIFKRDIVNKMELALYKTKTPGDYLFVLEYLFHSNSGFLFLKNYFGYNYYIFETSASRVSIKNMESDCESLRLLSDLLKKYRPDNYEIHYIIYNILLNIILTNLIKLSYLDKEGFNENVNLVYETESYLPFKMSVDIKVLDIFNNLVMKKRYTLARYYSKLVCFFSESKTIKKLYRNTIN